MLDIENPVEYNDIITGFEYHSHKPYASSTLNNNDEVRIAISQQDIITAPFESVLHISGKVEGKTAGATVDVHLVNNAIAHLFEDIRYEISGIEIDRTKYLGVSSTIKNLLSITSGEQDSLKNACWFGPGKTLLVNGDFTFSVPLKLLLGFFEDYKRIIVNVKQELILLRSVTDKNAVSTRATDLTLTISSLYWRVPHVTVSDAFRLKLLQRVEKDNIIHLPFRSWELHEYPTLPQTTRQSWTIKTSSQLEKPRFVILAFQTDRRNSLTKDCSRFDTCNLTNVKLYLNSQYFPYDNVHGDISLFYDMFLRFQSSYYGRSSCPVVDLDTFKDKTPLYVIDCSNQNDSIKVGPVDVRLEFEASQNFPEKTTAYCLLLHDAYYTYTLLSGDVKKMM